jgi:signal transduction histidine kinase
LRSDPSLIQAEKMASLGQLTAGIAHEIKNPLNFVNNFADLSVELLDELKETAAPAIAALSQDKRTEIDETIEMLTGNLDKIAEHGRRADGIVKSMLEHSRGSSGERWSVDLIDLIEDQRSSADLEIWVSDCFSSRPSSWTIDVARRKTHHPVRPLEASEFWPRCWSGTPVAAVPARIVPARRPQRTRAWRGTRSAPSG